MNIKMTEQECEEFLKKAQRINKILFETLLKEVKDESDPRLLLFIVADLTTRTLLILQEKMGMDDAADQYYFLIKESMAILGKDMPMQSLKNKIEEEMRILRDNEREIQALKERLARREEALYGTSGNGSC